MRFRLGFVTGFAGGYYLGTKAGRQRYEQISQTLQRVRASDAFEVATTKAKAAVDEGVDKAKDLIDRRSDGEVADGSPNGTATIPTAGTPPTAGPTDPPPYSSSR